MNFQTFAIIVKKNLGFAGLIAVKLNYVKGVMKMAEESRENKENMIALRLNNEQMLAVRQWAHQHNANISEVIRSAIELMTGAKQ